MPRKKCSKGIRTEIGKCINCKYCSNPHHMSLTGEPTLAKCEFEEWSVLYQRKCQNNRFKPK